MTDLIFLSTFGSHGPSLGPSLGPSPGQLTGNGVAPKHILQISTVFLSKTITRKCFSMR